MDDADAFVAENYGVLEVVGVGCADLGVSMMVLRESWIGLLLCMSFEWLLHWVGGMFFL